MKTTKKADDIGDLRILAENSLKLPFCKYIFSKVNCVQITCLLLTVTTATDKSNLYVF